MKNDTVDKLVSAWNAGDVPKIAACYAPGAVMHHPLLPQPLAGRDAISQFESGMFSAFSQLDWRAESIVRQGDQLALEFCVKAVNTAPMQTPKGAVPATNRRITLRGMSILSLNAAGEIAEERRYFDSGTLFMQLGLA